MTSLTRFDSQGIEIFINSAGESFASIAGVARMAERSESTIRDFIRARSVLVVDAKVSTPGGLQGARLLSESSICEVLAAYNPQRLQQFALLGIRTALHQLVGYQKEAQRLPLNSIDITHALSTSELVSLIGVALDTTYSGLSLKPELLAGLKLSAIEQFVPELKPMLLESRQLLINNTATEHKLMTATELGQRLGISAQAVNKKLVELGLQIKNPNKRSKKDSSYLPIGQGQEFSDLTLATGMGKDNTTYQQLRWYESVLSIV